MNQLNALAIALNEAKITVLLPEQMMFVKGGSSKRKKKSRSKSNSKSKSGCGRKKGTGTGAGSGGGIVVPPPVVSLP
jgi:uncharacterized membrane protein